MSRDTESRCFPKRADRYEEIRLGTSTKRLSETRPVSNGCGAYHGKAEFRKFGNATKMGGVKTVI
jgi:hypothetical protein